MRVFNFGSLNIDHVYEVAAIARTGETISSFNYEKLIGGKGLNQSIALAQAGVEVVHLGCIGDDGLFLLETLKQHGIDVSEIEVTDVPTGHAIIQVDQSGHNCIVLYPGANHQLSHKYIDKILATITSSDIILVQNETSSIDYLIEQAFKKHIPVAMNLAPVTANALALDLNKISYLLINETEGAALTDETDKYLIGRSLIDNYPNLQVILTLGEAGSLYFSQKETLEQKAYPTTAVDTTAAGDTFTGYFLATLLKERDVELALQLASLASSIAVEVKGAANSIPSLNQVITRLDELT